LKGEKEGADILPHGVALMPRLPQIRAWYTFGDIIE